MPGETLLTARELAQATRMSVGSVYKMTRAGRLPFYAAGPGLSGVRFDLALVKNALQRLPGSNTAEKAVP